MSSPRSSSSSPRSPRNLNRSQQGHTRPPTYAEVKSGSARIDQLSTPRYRVTGNDYSGNSNGFGGYSSPRVSKDQQTVFQSHENMQKRLREHPSSPAARDRALQETRIGEVLRPVPKIPTAVELLTSLKNHHEQNPATTSRSLLANTSHGVGAEVGIAGLILAKSTDFEDLSLIHGTKLQKHELCNTISRRAEVDSGRFPVQVPTSGRRKLSNINNNNTNNDCVTSSSLSAPSRTLTIQAPSPAAVRSLAISGIDTSRVEDRPVAPQYFEQEQKMTARPTRNGSSRYPDTMWMSQPKQDSGHYLGGAAQFNPNDRGLHNASTYLLEDKLRRKATDEIRISKCGWNEDAVAQRAQAEIDFKKARNDKRVAVKRQARLDYEERVGAGM